MESYQKNKEILDKTDSDKTKTLIETSRTTYNAGGYSKYYVKELEEELLRITKENVYLKSDEYRDRLLSRINISSSDKKLIELMNQNDHLLKENDYLKSDEYKQEILSSLQKENKVMIKKINHLCALIRVLSNESVEREDILLQLKQIMDMKSS